MRRKDKMISTIDSPVLGAFTINFIEKTEEKVREMARSRNRRWKSLSAATNNGTDMKVLTPIVNSAIKESIYAALGTDISDSENIIREKHLKQVLESFVKFQGELLWNRV